MLIRDVFPGGSLALKKSADEETWWLLSKGRLESSEESREATCVVAVAASAGGLVAVGSILSQLPKDFPAAVLLVQHLDPRYRSFMAQILSRRTELPVHEAQDQQPISSGNVYVAPPDHHLTVSAQLRISLSKDAQVHHLRPSADILFESVAQRYGSGSIAVVLTGSGSDGSTGIASVRRAGGTVIVQSARSAEFVGMPEAAIRTGVVDLILDLPSIPDALIKLVKKRKVQ